MVCNGLGIAVPDNIFYRYTHQLLASDIEAIQRHVLEQDINFMVVDSATPAVGEPESAQMTTEYFRALRSLRITTVTIGHVAKTGKENEPFGSIFWRNLPRANFRVNGAHEPGADSFTLGLKHTKSNNGKHLRDIGLEVRFTDDAVYHNIPMPACRGKAEIENFIKGFLAGNPDGIDFEIKHQVSSGNIVFNERIDSFGMGDKKIAAQVCGVFEVTSDGKIAAWRDYFDMGEFTGA